MPIPEELLPRTPKKEKPVSKSGDFDVKPKISVSDAEVKPPLSKTMEQFNNETPRRGSGQAMKKGFNWAWFARRILPIFLFVLLAAGISIAAITACGM